MQKRYSAATRANLNLVSFPDIQFQANSVGYHEGWGLKYSIRSVLAFAFLVHARNLRVSGAPSPVQRHITAAFTHGVNELGLRAHVFGHRAGSEVLRFQAVPAPRRDTAQTFSCRTKVCSSKLLGSESLNDSVDRACKLRCWPGQSHITAAVSHGVIALGLRVSVCSGPSLAPELRVGKNQPSLDQEEPHKFDFRPALTLIVA